MRLDPNGLLDARLAMTWLEGHLHGDAAAMAQCALVRGFIESLAACNDWRPY